MGFRKPEDDVRKSSSILKKQLAKNPICCVEGCNNSISLYTGPGSDVLCRHHQLQQVEYGGMGKYYRPHTFHRSWQCVECGYNPLEDPRLDNITDEVIKKRIARVLMHGDHQERAADGGDNSAQNVRSLCYVCHAKKTIINEDWKS